MNGTSSAYRNAGGAIGIVLLGLVLASGIATDAAAAVSGKWRCVRTDSRGYIHQCVMRLSVDPEDRIEGRIDWILLRSPQAADHAKLGLGGTEYVRGRVTSPESLFFEGYAEDDPNEVFGLDKYPLQLSPGGAWMFGRTENQGDWTGQFYATPQ